MRALSASVMPDGVYILGGYNGEQYVSDVHRYDVLSQQWKSMASMNTGRGTFVAMNSANYNYIYAIGGFNGKPLEHVERYDAMSNTWEYLSPMH